MFVCTELDVKWHSEDGYCGNFLLNTSPQTKILNASISKDNNFLAIVRENDHPQLYCVRDKRNCRVVHNINETGISVADFKHHTKKILALGTKTGGILIYDTKEHLPINRFTKVCDNAVSALQFTLDDRLLCGLDKNSFFVIPNVNSSCSVNRFHQDVECTVLKCSPSMSALATVGHTNGDVAIWDLGKCQETLRTNLSSPVTGIAVSNKNQLLIATKKDVKMCVIDCRVGTSVFEFALQLEQPVSAMDMQPNGNIFALGFADGTVKLYDTRNYNQPFFNRRVCQSEITKIMFQHKIKKQRSHATSSVAESPEIPPKKILADQDNPRDNQNTQSRVSFSNVPKKEDENSMAAIKQYIRNQNLERAKNNLFGFIESEMEGLENQLIDHCSKFQQFMDNEFDTIDAIIKEKWDIFSLGDINQVVLAIFDGEVKQ